MELRTILIEARALVAKGYCQHALAKDARGYSIPPGPTAVQWCVIGALAQVAPNEDRRPALAALHFVTAPEKQEGALALFDEALRRTPT